MHRAARWPRLTLLCIAASLAGCAGSRPAGSGGPAPADADAAVRAGIARIVEAANRQDVDAVLRELAPDVVLIHRDRQDARWDTIAHGFRETFARGKAVWSADVEEVLASGDLATARITWTFVLPNRPAGAPVYRERDMEVWRRDADGRWRLLRGLAFQIREAPR